MTYVALLPGSMALAVTVTAATAASATASKHITQEAQNPSVPPLYTVKHQPLGATLPRGSLRIGTCGALWRMDSVLDATPRMRAGCGHGATHNSVIGCHAAHDHPCGWYAAHDNAFKIGVTHNLKIAKYVIYVRVKP
jgi:hypothetical protein